MPTLFINQNKIVTFLFFLFYVPPVIVIFSKKKTLIGIKLTCTSKIMTRDHRYFTFSKQTDDVLYLFLVINIRFNYSVSILIV